MTSAQSHWPAWQRRDAIRTTTTRRRLIGIAAAFVLAEAVTAEAMVDATTRKLNLIAQSLNFLQHAPKGPVILGIVYPPASPGEAHQIEAAFGDGVQSGALTLRPRLLTVNEAFNAQGIIGLLLTDAALPDAPAIASAMAGKGVLTVASDPAAVSAGVVVMAVRIVPRIEIYLSRSAARTAGIEFSTPFRMMLQER
jgi:hypothetical protein